MRPIRIAWTDEAQLQTKAAAASGIGAAAEERLDRPRVEIGAQERHPSRRGRASGRVVGAVGRGPS